jgi:predicted RNase H-like HicB family nuclease
MTKQRNYRVEVEREPGWWIIRVPDLDDLTTQARRLGAVEQNAREAIAVWLDVDLDAIEVSPVIHPPEDVVADLRRSKVILDEAAAKQKEGAALAGVAIHRLIDDLGLTLREAGSVIGLSHQRVAQLAGKSEPSRQKSALPSKQKDPGNSGLRLGTSREAQGWDGDGGAPSISKKRSSA